MTYPILDLGARAQSAWASLAFMRDAITPEYIAPCGVYR